MKQDDETAKKSLEVLGFVISEITKMLAPFMPFLADFIYKDVTGQESVHLSDWSDFSTFSSDKNILDDMALVKEAVESGLSLRKENNLKVRQPLAELRIKFAGKNEPINPELLKIVAEELNVHQVSQADDITSGQNWMLKENPRVKIALDTFLTEELKAEGLARELERVVQDLRKKSILKVGELVDVYYNTGDEKIEDALLKLFDRKKTFVSQISKSLEVEADFETQAVIEGKAVWIGLVKI
jgi:isoleucyl-tRNA synthetase